MDSVSYFSDCFFAANVVVIIGIQVQLIIGINRQSYAKLELIKPMH